LRRLGRASIGAAGNEEARGGESGMDSSVHDGPSVDCMSLIAWPTFVAHAE
jgi:hypothetical protein